MNLRDSEVVCGMLKDAGYMLVDDADSADVVIFNTCSVRQHAEDKVWSEIGCFNRKPYAISHKPIIGIIGCMAQNYKDDIFRKAPRVDFVVGPQDIDKIPDIIRKMTNDEARMPKINQKKIWETDGKERPEDIYHTGFHQDKDHAFVVISEGCSNFCSYCVVPYVRGPLRNRKHKEIIREIREAIDKGISRFTLLGQNVNAFYDGEVDFIGMLGLVDKIKGVKEFSFVTSHPKDTSVELFKAMAECGKLKKYLHLPAQSGSDRILKAMNRVYTREIYLDLARLYRKIVKGGVLTTDIIVGFPGETEQDFQETYDLVKEVNFNSGFFFKYSPRPHTQAANLTDDVPRQEKERRHGIILKLQKEISKKHVKL